MGRHEPARRDDERHCSGLVTRQIVGVVRAHGGEEAVARLLDLAGEDRPLEVLEDDRSWSSYERTRSLFETAVALLGRPDAFRDRELLEKGRAVHNKISSIGAELAALFHSLGSASEVYRNIAKASAKYSTFVHIEALEVGHDHALIRAVGTSRYPRFRELCDYTIALLEGTPRLFGYGLSRVIETECQARGDDRCDYTITWSPTPLTADPQVAARYQAGTQLVASTRLEGLRSTVSDLVSSDDLETVLARIATQASSAVRAPRYLLAVRAGADNRVRIHQTGFSDGEAERLAHDLVAGALSNSSSRLIVDVVSARRHYGRLMADFPFDHGFFEEERSGFEAYARLAAAALDSATALDEARREAATSRALLDLARGLARLGTPDEIAQRLAEAVPAVVDCDRAGVMLWNPDREELVMQGTWGFEHPAAAVVASMRVKRSDTPLVDDLMSNPAPAFVTPGDPDPFVAGALAAFSVEGALIVPLASRGRIYGVLAAGVNTQPERLSPTGPLLERVAGIVDHAVTALENARLIEYVRHQALHDALTGLPNQRLLEDRVGTAVRRGHRSGDGVALLFLDIDRFKNINDTLGHGVGDELLIHVAGRLATAVRSEDTLARLSGDEFAILLPRCHSVEEAEVVARKILQLFREPFHVAGHELFITASIGIARFPEDGESYVMLLKNADTAMYRAKNAGRATYQRHQPDLSGRTYSKLALEADLHMALARRELSVLYQPQVEVETGRVVSVEALLRWRHPTLGMVPPDEFIPIAEETGLIVDIDAWVLRAAVRQARDWQRRGLPPLRVAVNLSARDLRDPALVARVESALAEFRLSPALLELEVTERVADGDTPAMAETLADLARLGVHLAIDDFGTGNSAFGRLRHGLITTVKVDKAFVQEITGPHDRAPLVEAIVAMSHRLGLRVVAEGVETEDQLAFLERHGCDMVQGYLYSPPVEADAVERLVRSSSASEIVTS